MKLTGFTRIGTGVPKLKLGDMDHNTEEILKIYDKASEDKLDLLVLPELCITGYTMADLFHQRTLLEKALSCLHQIKNHTTGCRPLVTVGLPLLLDDAVYNCAAVIGSGKILGIVPKSYLPTYNEFYETRWFAKADMLERDTILIEGDEIPIGTDLIFEGTKPPYLKFAAEICEDLWAPVPPSTHTALHGALIVANLSASNELIAKSDYRRDLIKTNLPGCIPVIYTPHQASANHLPMSPTVATAS